MFICVLNKTHVHPGSWVNIVCSTGGLRWEVFPVPGSSPSWLQGQPWNDTGCSSDPTGARSLGWFISWKGTLTITTMLLTPLLSLFFFLSFFKNLYFTFAVTLGFLQGNKSVSQCNKTKLFFLSLLPEHSETFYEHLFLSATVAKKPPTKQQREEEMRQKSPSCKCQGLPVEPTERWPCRSCQGLTRTLEWFGLERLKLVSFQPSTRLGLKSYLNLALSRLSPWLAVEFAVLYF